VLDKTRNSHLWTLYTLQELLKEVQGLREAGMDADAIAAASSVKPQGGESVLPDVATKRKDAKVVVETTCTSVGGARICAAGEEALLEGLPWTHRCVTHGGRGFA
jgi:hypothetical protein